MSQEVAFKQCDLGISYISCRRTSESNSTPLAPAPALNAQGLHWNLFIAQTSDVCSLQTWLEAVEARLNEQDICGDEKLCKYAPVFQVTSWGTKFSSNGTHQLLQQLVPDEQVYIIMTDMCKLFKPFNRISIESGNLPFEKYFLDPKHRKKGFLNTWTAHSIPHDTHT
jgi:hypothetical protein